MQRIEAEVEHAAQVDVRKADGRDPRQCRREPAAPAGLCKTLHLRRVPPITTFVSNVSPTASLILLEWPLPPVTATRASRKDENQGPRESDAQGYD